MYDLLSSVCKMVSVLKARRSLARMQHISVQRLLYLFAPERNLGTRRWKPALARERILEGNAGRPSSSGYRQRTLHSFQVQPGFRKGSIDQQGIARTRHLDASISQRRTFPLSNARIRQEQRHTAQGGMQVRR